MGYSFTTPIKSKKAQQQMLAFLEKHYRPWSELTKGTILEYNPDYDATRYICTGEDLSYDHGKCRIGFDYSRSDDSTPYMHGILRFMALQVGRRRALPNDTGSPEAVPYIVYDGYEAWPVLLLSKWNGRVPKHSEWALCTESGFKRALRTWENRPEVTPPLPGTFLESLRTEKESELEETDRIVQAELNRLLTLWRDHSKAP
jgi:hypothetical protein